MVGSYILVIPGVQDDSFAKAFSRYGEVRVAASPPDLKQIVSDYGPPTTLVVSSTLNDVVNNVGQLRGSPGLATTRILVVGHLSPSQIAELASDDVVGWPLPDDFHLDNGSAPAVHDRPAAFQTQIVRQSNNAVPDDHPVTAERTIVVVSPDGGDGKTTVTMNMARLCAKWGYKPLVIEADYSGRASEWLQYQTPIRSLQEFSEEKSWDRAMLEDMLVSAEGIKLLPASPEKIPILRENLERAIRAYRRYYSLILIDLHQSYSPLLQCATEFASHVILVATQSEKKLSNVTFLANKLMEMRVKPKQLSVVVNRATKDESSVARVRIATEDFGNLRYYKLPWLQELCDDDSTIYPALGRSEYARSFEKLMKEGLQITPVRREPVQGNSAKRRPEPQTSSGGLFGWLRRDKAKKNASRKRGRKS